MNLLYQHARPPFWQRHPWITGATAFGVLWVFLHAAYPVIAATAIVGLMIYIGRRRRASAQRDAALRARADYEYRLNLAGDPRGIYGQYPPVLAGWFPDPQRPWQLRYFDGAAWTGYTVRR
jgi:hypothetical protein